MPHYNICYFIGGTGARIAEATVHMLASGYFSRDEGIEFVIIDKDYKCKSYTDAMSQVDKYNTVREIVLSAQNGDSDMFKTEITRHNWSFNNIFNNLVGVEPNATLASSVVSKTNEKEKSTDEVLLNGLYSADEQNKPTERGFYGHPSIGALMFKYMTKLPDFNLDEYDIASPILKKLNDNYIVKVFIVGTVFGGTGASVISNLARYIRNRISDKNDEQMTSNLIISGVLVLPYFSIVDETDSDAEFISMNIDSREFLPKSEVALKHYGLTQNLIRNNGESWVFDRLYAVGSRPYHQTSEKYSEGGEEQKSHFDFVDILSASAMFDFFSSGDAGRDYALAVGTSNIMLYKRQDGNLDWQSMPSDLKNRLLQMLRFSSFIITQVYPYFYLGNLDEATRRNNEMAKNLYGQDKDGHKAEQSEMDALQKQVENVFNYCASFVKLIYDITNNGNNWASFPDEPEIKKDVNLYHRDYIKQLYRLSNVLLSGKGDPHKLRENCIALTEIRQIIPKEDSLINNTSIQNSLNDYFDKESNKPKKIDEPKTRVGKYLMKAYTLCQ